jgi:hypothetical protein
VDVLYCADELAGQRFHSLGGHRAIICRGISPPSAHRR